MMLLADDTDLTWPAPSNFPIVKKNQGPKPKAHEKMDHNGPRKELVACIFLLFLEPTVAPIKAAGHLPPLKKIKINPSTFQKNHRWSVRVRQFVGP